MFVYVSRDDGLTWFKCLDGRSVIFPAFEEAQNSLIKDKFKVKVEFSTTDAGYTPHLYYLKMEYMSMK